MTADLDKHREAWKCAGTFPPDKEDPGVYGQAHTTAQEFDLHRGKRVLEYGCGGGADAMSYLRRGCDVTLADIVADNVATAMGRIREAGLHQKATGIVLRDNAVIAGDSFDVANADGVIHHIPEPLPVLQEIWRVLKPGGLFYCMLYTEFLWRRLQGHITGKVAAYEITPHQAFCSFTDGHDTYARSYTEDEGRALLESAGFREVTVTALYNGADFRTFRGAKTACLVP